MIRILYVDDEEGLLDLGKIFLENAGGFSVDTFTSATEALTRISSLQHDAIVSDYQMPGMDGIAFLKAVRAHHGDIPFILFTGRGREEVVIEAINNGADFYLQKGGEPKAQFAELAHKVKQAVQRRCAESSLKESETRFRTLADAALEGIMIHDHGIIADCNKQFAAMFGYSPDEIIGRNGFEFLMTDASREEIFRWKKAGAAGSITITGIKRDGTSFFGETTSATITWQGKEHAVVHMLDITERKRAEEMADRTIARERGEAGAITAMASHPDLATGRVQEFLHDLTEAAGRVLGTERTGVWFFDVGGTQLVEADTFTASSQTHASGTVLQEGEYQNEFDSLRLEKFIDASDVLTDPRVAGYVETYFRPNRITALLDAVIRVGGTNVGVLCLEHVDREHRWQPDEITFACQLADQVALAVSNRERQKVEGELRAAYEQITASDEELREQLDELTTKENALRISNEQFGNVIEFSPFGTHFYELDPGGELIFTGANPAADTILKVENSHFIGKTIEDAFPSLVETEIPGQYKNVAKNGGTWHTDQIVYEEGFIQGAFSVTAFRIRPGAMVAVFFDITERKRAENALRESEERFRTLIEIGPFMCVVNDLEGRYLYVNKAFEEAAGYSSAELIGRSAAEMGFVDPEKSRDFFEYLKTGGKIDGLETVTRHRDGSLVNVLISSRYIAINEKPHIISIILDITQRKRAEEELRASYEQISATEEELRAQYDMLADSENRIRESEEKYRTIFESAGDAIFTLDHQGIVDCNTRAEQIFGRSRDQIIGSSPVELSPEHQPDGSLSSVKAQEKITAALSGEPQMFEWVHTRSDGTPFNADVSLTRFRVRDDYILQAIVRDVTERIRSQKALEQAKKKLNILNTVTFNDIQTMIFTISGYQHLAKQMAGEGPAAPIIEKEEEILRKITGSLKFARSYQGLGLTPPRWQDTGQVFLMAISHLDYLEHSEELDGLEIFADPMLELVFQVLADNVLKHGKTATRVSLRYVPGPGSATILFEDNGTGIPNDLKERIFSSDFQHKKAAGLFLAREILAITGITITETGEPGKGARFEMVVLEGAWRITPLK